MTTISADGRLAKYTASAGQDTFPFPFEVLEEDELRVLIDGVAQTLGSDFTVTGVPGTGNVVLSTPATGGELVLVYSARDIERVTDFETGQVVMLASELNFELSSQTIISQELARSVTRALRAPIEDGIVDWQLPAAASRLGKFLRFNDSSGAPEMSELLVAGTVLSADVIGGHLYPQSTAEIANNDTPAAFLPYNDIDRYQPVGDGMNDDFTALRAAFRNAPGGLDFPRNGGYAFTQQLTIAAGMKVDFRNTTLYFRASDATDTPMLVVAAGGIIGDLNLVLPTGFSIHRFLKIEAGAEAHNVLVMAEDQINNLGAASRAAIVADGDYTRLHDVRVEKFDQAFRIQNGVGGYWDGLRATSYAKAFGITNCTDYWLDNAQCQTKSPNGTTNPGHNSLVVENPARCKHSNLVFRNSGEHGIYLSVGAAGVEQVDFDAVQIEKPGQCGVKMSGQVGGERAKRIQFSGLEVVDCSTGNVAGANEEGLRIEQCDDVKVTGYKLRRVDDLDGAHDGIYLRDVTHVHIPEPYIQGVARHGIYLADEGQAEAINNVFIPGAKILSPGGDAVHINVKTAGSELRNIFIERFFAGAMGGSVVTVDSIAAVIAQTVRISGEYRTAVATPINLPTALTNTELRIDLQHAEDREVLAADGAASLFFERTVFDTSAVVVDLTLADGLKVGQKKYFLCSSAVNGGTLTVAKHATSNPEVFSVNTTTAVLALEWMGIHWRTVYNVGFTT